MKKMIIVLLSATFVLNLVLVIGMLGECYSPRQVFYTITDEMMNSAYRFKRDWKLKHSWP